MNPKQNDGEDGTAPSTDSSDDIYKTHDTDYRECDTTEILANDPEQWRKDCKRDADYYLVNGLKQLSVDPKQWIMTPEPGKETPASLFRTGAKWLFR